MISIHILLYHKNVDQKHNVSASAIINWKMSTPRLRPRENCLLETKYLIYKSVFTLLYK